MGKWIEQTVLKRSTDDKEIHKEMFSILGHKGNQMKTTLRFYSVCSEWQSSRKTTNAGEDVGKGALIHLGGNVHECSHDAHQHGGSSKN
jgi:hypothetical protein